ncbi:hypothetical protein [Chryseobacterium sp. ERMR1:04]|uniref:hypothetical protein n=1 Tax=Chryseobacterium sp. ERMR1:04 TaxID=1705393 RepID=UPI0006C84341|nr:hypothetical protein [Chryseobacterium sp. ERMR1:04]KPH14980.1 hypothetical protein AMQ68_06110 [Chryseobacterium sp. ERMR1:04]
MRKILIFICIVLVFSCQAQREKNDILSKNKKLYSLLYKTNGNIFVLGSSEFESSYMWSYTKKNLVIYNLRNGKLINEKTLNLKEQNNKWRFNPSKDDSGIDRCIATDGFTLMYKVKDGGSFIERRFPVSLECLKNSSYETDFFKNLVSDINFYNIGWGKHLNE